MNRRLKDFLLFVLITLSCCTLGVIIGNLMEAWKHDVSFHDAFFIESWRSLDRDGLGTTPPPTSSLPAK